MTDREGESLIDKVRNAFGGDVDAEVVNDPSDVEVANRPAGPDYAAEEPIDGDFGAGLDREARTRTAGDSTGTGLGYDFDRVEVTDETVTDPDDRL